MKAHKIGFLLFFNLKQIYYQQLNAFPKPAWYSFIKTFSEVYFSNLKFNIAVNNLPNQLNKLLGANVLGTLGQFYFLKLD